jgi:hypothetical protein
MNEEKTKEQIVKEIDYLIGRYYDLCNKKEPLTETEQKELRGYGIKFTLFGTGVKLSGMGREEYLSLTDRDWGEKAQKEIAEGKRQWDNRTEEERNKTQSGEING